MIYIIARTIYLAVDPFRQKLIFSRVADKILYELIFSAAIYIFYILLIVWIGLYSAFNSDVKEFKKTEIQNINKSTKQHFRFYEIIKEVIIIFIFFIYPIQITLSYFRGSRSSNKDLLDNFLFIMFAFIMFFILVFAYLTCKLKITLSRSYEIPLNNQQDQLLEDDEEYEYTTVDENDEILFFKKLKENKKLNVIVKNLLNPDRESHKQNKYKKNNGLENIREENEDSDNDSDFELEYENEMINMNLQIFDGKENIQGEEMMLVKSDINVDIPKIESKETRRESVYSIGNIYTQRPGKDFVLTNNDMNILNKVN